MPAIEGVPVIVITFDAQVAVTPVGKFVGVPIPVASVVAWVVLVNAVLIHNVGVVLAVPAVISSVTTIIVPVAFTVPQPPVKGML